MPTYSRNVRARKSAASCSSTLSAAGIDSRLERTLGEEERAEGVDRADREAVERAARVLDGASCARRSFSVRAAVLEGGLEPPPQVRGRLARERDGRDVLGAGLPRRRSASIRSTSIVVLPEPAPASTRSVRSSSVRIAWRASASGQRVRRRAARGHQTSLR